jgi:manganese efflux pump family protein
MENFKNRWNITSNWQVFVILVVFAITGSTAAFLSKPILSLFGITKTATSAWIYYPLYILLIFPVYQILLVGFGFLFGQHSFFWAFEKKMLRSMKLGFIADWFEKKKGT